MLSSPINQRGAALVVSMMMLVAITLIGVAVMGNSRLEWLMASNSNAQTSIVAKVQTALGVAEDRIILKVCGSAAPPPGCYSTKLSGGWDAPSDEFYDATTSPPAADPRKIESWSTIGVDLGGGRGRYLVIRRACAHPPGFTYPTGFTTGPPAFTSGSCGIQSATGGQPFTDIYDVWVMVSDTDTNTTRIARSTFATATNPTTTSLSIFGRTIANGQSASQRIGYVEITN